MRSRECRLRTVHFATGDSGSSGITDSLSDSHAESVAESFAESFAEGFARSSADSLSESVADGLADTDRSGQKILSDSLTNSPARISPARISPPNERGECCGGGDRDQPGFSPTVELVFSWAGA